MDDSSSIDWALTTFDGLRQHQHAEFRDLPLREKIRILENMLEVADAFGRSMLRDRPNPPR